MIITISVIFFSLFGVLFGERRFRKKERKVCTQEKALLVLMGIREQVQARDFPIQEAMSFHKGKDAALDKELEAIELEDVFTSAFYSKDLILIELDGLIKKHQEKVQKALTKLAGEHLIYIYLGLLVGFLLGLGYGIFIML